MNPPCKKRSPFVNELCIGCWVCTAISPESFELDEDGISHAVKLENHDEANVDDAISACPVSAISWKEES